MFVKKSSKIVGIGLLLVIMLFVQACSNSGSNQPSAGGSSNTDSNAGTGGSKPITVTWWHSMGGDWGTAMDKLVQSFNSSQSGIIVEATYQGTYDESMSKMKASLGAKNGPSIIQIYEVGTRFMLDSGMIRPVQDFIDQEGYDDSHLEENIANYYRFDNKLYSMPFNTSNPILYYNKDLFKAASLDPEQPPATFDEVYEAAKTLTSGDVSGFGLFYEGWFVEQFFAKQGALYVDNDNGRTAPATQSLMNSQAGVNILSWWKKLLDDKVAINFGRSSDDTRKAFVSGQVAMMLGTTSFLRGIVSGVDGKFEIGTAALPSPDPSVDGGVIIGGGSNWILNDKSEEEQLAAWEFVKFLSSPETQAAWSVDTGYFPISSKAYDQQVLQDNLKQYPQFVTAVEQLHATQSAYTNQGAVMGVFPEQRNLVLTAVEEAISNARTVQEALDVAAEASTRAIQKYNETNK